LYNSILNTLIIGKKIIYLPSCHSTNDIAAELVHNGLAEEGTIVITDNQVGGRGQRGAKWHTEPSQNLTFSVVLRPGFIPIGEQFLISQMVALAIYHYLSLYTREVFIKWPNDIYIASKKISGTLIENAIQGASLSYSVVGIGININQLHFDSSAVTSLAKVSGHSFSLPEELAKIARLLDAGYLKLKSLRQQETIRSEYLQHLYGYQQALPFIYNNKRIAGTVTGVTHAGKLCMAIAGRAGISEFGLKEIEWVWD
jgi:BirA family biotin operon repressor/biotin-[acetyl-CoA-carboxylase] ligase